MAKKARQLLERTKNRRSSGAFVPIPVSIAMHPNYMMLNGSAVKLLLDMCFQLHFKKGGPDNNGDISIAWTIMRERGWRSKETIRRAELELLYYGFIELTRQGGRRKCNLYSVSFFAIDACEGKLDVKPTNIPRNLWKDVKEPYKHGVLKKLNPVAQ